MPLAEAALSYLFALPPPRYHHHVSVVPPLVHPNLALPFPPVCTPAPLEHLRMPLPSWLASEERWPALHGSIVAWHRARPPRRSSCLPSTIAHHSLLMSPLACHARRCAPHNSPCRCLGRLPHRRCRRCPSEPAALGPRRRLLAAAFFLPHQRKDRPLCVAYVSFVPSSVVASKLQNYLSYADQLRFQAVARSRRRMGGHGHAHDVSWVFVRCWWTHCKSLPK